MVSRAGVEADVVVKGARPKRKRQTDRHINEAGTPHKQDAPTGYEKTYSKDRQDEKRQRRGVIQKNPCGERERDKKKRSVLHVKGTPGRPRQGANRMALNLASDPP